MAKARIPQLEQELADAKLRVIAAEKDIDNLKQQLIEAEATLKMVRLLVADSK